MQAVSFSELRKDMKHIMDGIRDRHEPTIVTRRQGNMVLMSLEDYNALEETAYILSSPKNAQRILESLEELRSGKGHEHQLTETED
jgi:antitoxin YefM